VKGTVSLLDLLVRYRIAGGFLAAVLFLWLARPDAISPFYGGLVALAGLGIRGWGVGYIRKGQELTQDGPYSVVRNPLYLGSFFVGLGVCLMGRRFWILPLYVLAFALVYHRKMQQEEEDLLGIYGEAYRAYCARVPRIIPRRLLPAPGRGWSLRLLLFYREWELWLGILVVTAVLWLKGRLA
jgi:protein-S-isoprenylcysteine O-methyltransferase Ste14